jgi:NADH dehydrogenase (ubiquinone) Fe-S protein 5
MSMVIPFGRLNSPLDGQSKIGLKFTHETGKIVDFNRPQSFDYITVLFILLCRSARIFTPNNCLISSAQMSLGPAFRSPFTDLTGSLINHQYFGQCAEFEMRAVDCLEAYGIVRGAKKCTNVIEDFNECVLQKKQFMRLQVI